MSSQIRFTGWKSEGMRCPDHQLDFTKKASGKKNDLFEMVLLQEPNGGGKTTVLNLVKAALCGSAENWDSQKIAEFKGKDNTTNRGNFILQLQVGNKPLTIEILFDFSDNTASYRTTYGAGVKDRFSPPSEARLFFQEELVDLYVFDGELAKKLLDPSQTQAETAIDSLFQISNLKKIQAMLASFWENHRASVSATADQGVSLRENKVRKLERHLSDLKKKRKAAIDKKSKLEKQIQKEEQSFHNLFGKDKRLQDKYTECKVNLGKAQQGLDGLIGDALLKLRNPQSLSTSISEDLSLFKSRLDKLKLPSSTSKQFFIELSEEEDCICERPIDAAAKKAILKNAPKYLGSEEVAVLNAIKSDIANFCTKDEARAARTSYEEMLKEIEQTVRQRDEANDELMHLQSTSETKGNKEIEEKRKLLESLALDLKETKEELEQIDGNGDYDESDTSRSIKMIEKRLEDARKKFDEVANTQNLRRSISLVNDILRDAASDSRSQIQERLVRDTNKQIKNLLADNPLMVQRIGNSVEIGQAGASEGQTLAVGYAFLTGLLSNANHQVPFIVDSPVGSLGLRVRREVARIVPSLSGQVLMFVLSSERNQFVESLQKHSGKSIKYFTLFRHTPETEVLKKAAMKAGGTASRNGVVVEDVKFFNSFELEAED